MTEEKEIVAFHVPVSDDMKLVILPEAQAAMDADPDLAKLVRELNANFHQAMQGVKDGKYVTFEDAMEAITGQRPEKVDLDDDDDDLTAEERILKAGGSLDEAEDDDEDGAE